MGESGEFGRRHVWAHGNIPQVGNLWVGLANASSAVSIPSNIAEGRRRGTKREFRQFLLNAFGSGAELETQLEIVQRLGFGKEAEVREAVALLEEVMRM